MLITILGFMGSGKSTLGKMIANRLGLNFIDLDDYIEENEKKSIPEIFKNNGEQYFRTLETQYLNKLLECQNTVISLGGGTPCFNNNIKSIITQSRSLFIDIPIEQLISRLSNARRERPLIKDMKKAELKLFISEKLMLRRPFYEQAEHSIKASKEALEEVIHWINKEKP
jgi:shikimate kinase